MERPLDHSVRRRDSSREDEVAVVGSVTQADSDDQGQLGRFRGRVYDCFDRRPDALFDVIDSVCTPITIGGVAYVGLGSGRASRAWSRLCGRVGGPYRCRHAARCAGRGSTGGLAAGLRRRYERLDELRRRVLTAAPSRNPTPQPSPATVVAAASRRR
jgi:hypothetical protein